LTKHHRFAKSQASWSVDAASQLLDSFIAAVAPALLFLQHLRAVRVMRWDVDADAPACMAQVGDSNLLQAVAWL